jgi:hypothetical protein
LSNRIRLLVALLIPLFFISCSPAYLKFIDDYKFDRRTHVPDYSNLDYWAAHPYKKNPSDSVPAPLRSSFRKDSAVDVFFLHPTTLISKKETAWNADINDSVVNAKTDYTTILYQASAFNEGRMFAPRYRQANIRAYFSNDTANALRAFDTAYEDIKTAFRYYLDHFNQGRPIIIASHSQGTTHAERLLKEFFENKPLQSQLVAAYLIGMVIPKNYFESLKPCRDSAQTGCFVGWRSFQEGYEPDFVKKENGNSYVVNPLSWVVNEDLAPSSLNRGAVLLKFNKVLPQFADAQIHDGVLWMHKPHFPGSFLYHSKNYHIGDINLFYVNIRDNMRARVNAFRKH